MAGVLQVVTVSLAISKSKTLYLLAGLVTVLTMAMFAAQREVLVDTANYYQFYRDLMDHGIRDIASCRGFEPLFCGGSYLFAKLTQSDAAVHFIWVSLYYAIILRAFLEFWPLFVSERKYSPISLIAFAFVVLNYVSAETVYFLTRQYVASSLLTLGIAQIANKKSPVLPFMCAGLIHFGSLPIAAIMYFATRRRIDFKVVIAGLIVLLVAGFVATNSIVQFYLSSVTYKLGEYANKNDGNVTITQEIKVFLYLASAVYVFWISRTRLSVAYILLYAAYLLTFRNALFHLRYYVYLESMVWPSAFILFYVRKQASGHLVLSALSYRMYKTVSLMAPQLSIFYMGQVVLLSFMSFVSSLR